MSNRLQDDDLWRLMNARNLAATNAAASEWGAAVIEGAVSVAPGPEFTDTATGRTRNTAITSTGELRFHDPGPQDMYYIPTAKDGRYGVRNRRRVDESAFFSVGTPYFKYIELIYPMIKAGAKSGRAALKSLAVKGKIRKAARRVRV